MNINQIKMLNKIVYVIVNENEPYCLIKGKIYMINKNLFILKEQLNEGVINEFRIEYDFKDKNKTWFETFNEAKNYLKSKKYILEKNCKDEWNCYYIGDEINDI